MGTTGIQRRPTTEASSVLHYKASSNLLKASKGVEIASKDSYLAATIANVFDFCGAMSKLLACFAADFVRNLESSR